MNKEKQILLETLTLLSLKEIREVMDYCCKENETCDTCMLNNRGNCVAATIDDLLFDNNMLGD